MKITFIFGDADAGEVRPLAVPPPPHDPGERVVVDLAGDWQVRVFAPQDRKRAYFIRRGMWHAQLWHPGAGVSLLTPSMLTDGCFEVFPFRAQKARAETYEAAARAIRKHHGVDAPEPSVARRIQRWFVDGEVRRVVSCGA
jgi:hypothetical protein